MDRTRNVTFIAILCFVLILCASVYLPGKSGPYIFDDYTNLLYNSYLKIHTLDFQSLYQAAFSLDSGPLKRPISMVSFALNYYFAGSMRDPTPFKMTNLGIHIVNGLLLFWMMRIIYSRLVLLKKIRGIDNENHITLLAFATALLWMVQPIQVSTVLYVVQRMTELSALFTILGLIVYLKGRFLLLAGQKQKAYLALLGFIVFGGLGMFSKENAVLLPVFALVLELALFSKEWPWKLWKELPVRTRRAIVGGLAILAIASTVVAVCFFLPDYASRRFTMLERLMTEGRVIFFYISLILLPQINQFGHQHDDIPISTSLLHPWTTLPALAGIAGLLVLAIAVRKKQPLISLGILWFFAGQLLESTIVALEIAYEHRNYLPSLGVIIAMIGVIDYGCVKLKHNKLWWLVPVATLVFGGTTYLRSTQWADPNSFYRYEALHHPHSARVQAGMAILLEAQGHLDQSIEALKRAAKIEPYETGYLLQMHLLAAREGKILGPEEQQKTVELLATAPLSASTFLSIQQITGCLQSSCKLLSKPMERWLRVILNRKTLTGDRSYYYYALGLSLVSQDRVDEAIKAFERSFQLDPLYLHPLFALADIYVQLKQTDNAERVLAQLRSANRGNPHPRDREIGLVASDIEKLKHKAGSRSSKR
ncbi:MAG: tetratricopeptide repeat protein [Sulfuricaulis sp.]